MVDDASLYRLMSWLSPGFPVGAYSYSHGIEYAVEAGLVHDAGSLADWIETVLVLGAVRIEGALFRDAYAAAEAGDRDGLAEVTALANAFRGTAELARESLAQGEAFLAAVQAAWPAPALDRLAPPVAYPVAVAACCAGHGVARRAGLHAYLHAVAANLVSAGVRLIPLGQTDGQRVVAALEPAVAEALETSLALDPDDLGAAAPVIDWASMRHETQYTRLFRS